jgi:DNA modification methylase
MKPIELVTRGVMNSSEINGIVLDLFLGSGSTLIACEKTNRICFGMELDPKYVDTIIQRYVDYTGNEKVIKNGKEITWKRSKKTGE